MSGHPEGWSIEKPDPIKAHLEDKPCPFSERCPSRESRPPDRKVRTRRTPWSYLRIFGSGFVTGAANDDPSNVATFSQAGAQFGYGFLWVTLFTYPLLAAVQEVSARIGAVTGWGLSGNIRENYGKGLLYFMTALSVLANTLNLGADIGVMAEAVQLIVPVPYVPLLLGITGVVLVLLIYVPYKSCVRVLKWLALFLIAYPLTLVAATGSWADMLLATIRPRFQFDLTFVYMFTALIGTTISPYMMYWQAAELVEDEVDQGIIPHHGTRPVLPSGFMRAMRIDTLAGMLFSQIPCWAITAVSADVLFRNGIRDIPNAAAAARALVPLVDVFPHSGFVASTIFALGIIGVGLLAVPVFAGSASYAVAGALKCRMGLSLTYLKAPCFYSVIVGSTVVGLLLNFVGFNPIKALIFASVFNGMCSVPLIYLVARIARKERVMGEYRSGLFSHVLVWLAFGVVTASVLLLAASFFIG